MKLYTEKEDEIYAQEYRNAIPTGIELPDDEEIEMYGLDNILDSDSEEGFEKVRIFQLGASFVINRIKEQL
jgi:hypothetical protein